MPNRKPPVDSPVLTPTSDIAGEMNGKKHPGWNGNVPAGLSYTPDRAFLSRILGQPVARVQARPVKNGGVPAIVYRLRVHFASGREETLMLKRMAPHWPEDAFGHERETQFYRFMAAVPDLPLPHVYYAGPEPDGQHMIVLMADFAQTHVCRPPTYRWQMADMPAILSAYARLHALGGCHLPLPAQRHWLFPRMASRIVTETEYLPQMVMAVSAAGKWPDLPRFSRLLSWLLSQIPAMEKLPATILHMDVYPPNVALPRHGLGSALLIDWDMVSVGLAELDLAFMFLQPYRAHEALDREQVLAQYWQERAALDGEIPSPAERAARQFYADVLWAVWLVPRAYHLLDQPFPPDSGPGRYWASMYNVLGDRLLDLTATVE